MSSSSSSSKFRESERENTFTSKKWPHIATMNLSRFASAGFYYTFESDIVQCFACNVKIGNWKVGDDPREVHKYWSSSCKFINNISSCNNIEKHQSLQQAYYRPLPKGPRIPERNHTMRVGLKKNFSFSENNADHKWCTVGDVECRVNDNLEVQIKFNADKLKSILTRNVLDYCSKYSIENFAITINDPYHLNFTSFDKRVASFIKWPKNKNQPIEYMARSGFFYIGTPENDRVCCFHCGVHVQRWEEDDDAIIEHFKWSRGCQYLKVFFGKEGFEYLEVNYYKCFFIY